MKKLMMFMLIFIISAAGESKDIYFGIVDYYGGGEFALEDIPKINFRAWLTNGEGPEIGETVIINENYPGNSVEQLGGFRAACHVDLANFDAWGPGNTLYIKMGDGYPGDVVCGEREWIITDTPDSVVYLGFEDAGIPGSGSPTTVYLDTDNYDPYRLNDSTFVYPCIRTVSTGYNFVALPFDTGWTMASDLDPSGQNINMVSKFPSAYNSGYRSAVYNSYFGWINDFPVVTGGAYIINALNSFDFAVTGDSIHIPPYEFIAYDLTSFMVPLNRIAAYDNRDIWEETGFHCDRMYRFIPEGQYWVTDGASFTPMPFPVTTGMPLIARATTDFQWPLNKTADSDKENYDPVFSAENSSFTGPKPIFFHVVDEYGNDFDLTNSNVTFKAWVNNRPHEVLNQQTGGCGIMMLEDKSVCYLDLKSLTTNFQGDSLIFVVKDETEPDLDNWLIGSTSLNVGYDSDPIFKGFESVLPGTGSAISTAQPSSVSGKNLPSNTALHQNYPNPFNPETVISLSLPREEQVTLSVFNMNGQLVKELVNGMVSAGNHSINFNASDLNSGIYFYTLETGSTKLSKKMLLVK